MAPINLTEGWRLEAESIEQRTRHFRMWRIFVIGLIAAVVALQEDSDDGSEAAGRREAGKGTVKALGRVVDENGTPIAGATIRVAVPAADMRLVYPGCGHRIVSGTTDAEGRYNLPVPLHGEKNIAVDAMKPGFQSASGPPMSGGDVHRGNVADGGTFEASFTLKPGIYAAGTVVDELGKLIAGVHVRATIEDDTSSGWIGDAITDDRGQFEIFNFPAAGDKDDERGVLVFRQAQFVPETIKDIYALAPAEQRHLSVKMGRGRSISGIVLDASGKPVSEAVVEATFGDVHIARKAAMSGADGRFSIVGLPERKAVVRVWALSIKQHLETSLDLNRDRTDLELRLKPVVITDPLDSIEILGLKLATITRELRAAYFLDAEDQGVIVLDPGKNSARLNIGELEEGDFFWIVGSRPVKSARQFVDAILAICARQQEEEPPFVVGVVYGLNRVDFSGTNTQWMELTPEDVAQLKRVATEQSARPEPASVLQEKKDTHAVLGVRVADQAAATGVPVIEVVVGSAADRAGIHAGDIITQVGEVRVKKGGELLEAIRSKKPGEKVVIEVLREVQEEQQKIRLPTTLDEY